MRRMKGGRPGSGDRVEAGKILVVKPSSLGDVVHALPFLNALRSSLPGAEIHWVIARGLEGMLEGHPYVERLWVIDKEQWKRVSRLGATLSGLKALVQGLRAERYDLAVDLQGLLRSALITAFSGASLKAGFSDARELSPLFYDLKTRGGGDIHAVDRYLKLAALLGMRTGEVLFPFPQVREDNGVRGQYWVVVPGARWPSKRWPVEYFIEVVKALPMRAVIIGGRDDAGIAGRIVSALPEGTVVNLAGKTDLPRLLSVIKGASFMVSNDSGPMHIGAALSVPVYALFGPTSEVLTGPYGEGHHVFRAPIECSPCFRRTCRTMRCMRDLVPEEVAETIRRDMTVRAVADDG